MPETETEIQRGRDTQRDIEFSLRIRSLVDQSHSSRLPKSHEHVRRTMCLKNVVQSLVGLEIWVSLIGIGVEVTYDQNTSYEILEQLAKTSNLTRTTKIPHNGTPH